MFNVVDLLAHRPTEVGSTDPSPEGPRDALPEDTSNSGVRGRGTGSDHRSMQNGADQRSVQNGSTTRLEDQEPVLGRAGDQLLESQA